ncbi:hypothetical protein ACFVZ3_08210 [Kitasatospora purpeofusca]|uniref:hypothetical protein n=1 Tax=Kitasatospora purpeofusca TaxID=67352 RepID=UPI00369368DE
MTHPYVLRVAKPVADAIRDLPADARNELRIALLRAQTDPFAWPQADRYDMDDTVRIVTTTTAIAHYAIVPTTPHLWLFAVAGLWPPGPQGRTASVLLLGLHAPKGVQRDLSMMCQQSWRRAYGPSTSNGAALKWT